jgi:hypothetical protein
LDANMAIAVTPAPFAREFSAFCFASLIRIVALYLFRLRELFIFF